MISARFGQVLLLVISPGIDHMAPLIEGLLTGEVSHATV
jgi:hypothetical protein